MLRLFIGKMSKNKMRKSGYEVNVYEQDRVSLTSSVDSVGEEAGNKYLEFVERAKQFFGMKQEYNKDDTLCWQFIYEVVETNKNVTLAEKQFNMSYEIILAAMLLNEFHGKKICIIEPTAFFYLQVSRKFKNIADMLSRKFEDICFAIATCPTRNYDVVFYHGKKFSCFDPHTRSVVQIFVDMDVPEDPSPVSALRWHTLPSSQFE